MPCKGTCQVEQHEWSEDRIRHNPYNGAPYTNPADSEQEVAATTTDAQVWENQDLSKFTDLLITLGFDFSAQWTAGVDRQFPRHGRVLDCTDPGCICDWDRNKPKVIQDWPKAFTRYEVFVRYVWRRPKDGDPTKVFVTRYLLKGAILHRKRIIQGVCKTNPAQPVVPPFAPVREETEGEGQ